MSAPIARVFCLLGIGVAFASLGANRDVDSPALRDLLETAIRYEHGEGVPRRSARAAELYCLAIRLGSADAAYRLGWMYAIGRGIEKDHGRAVALFRRAGENGHSLAAQMLTRISADNPQLPECVSEPLPVDIAQPQPAAPEPAQDAASDQAQVVTALENWVRAWSKKDVEGYLAAYSMDFVTSGGQSLRLWERDRRARIANKTWIEVKIQDLSIEVEGELARAKFVQEYRSNNFTESSGKSITLVKRDRRWLIRQEEGAISSAR